MNDPKLQSVTSEQVADWLSEETLVDRRNRLGNRIRRLFRWGLWYKIPLAIFVIGLFIPDVMLAFVTVFGVTIQISVRLATALLQFVAIFWFLSRSRMYEVMPGAEGIGFADYRGQPELLEQAKQIVLLLKGVRAYEGAGGEPLNGLLLEGPPGTGKTWLAKAISTEAGVPFFYVDTASLQGTFIGTGALKIGRVYAKARRAAKIYGAAVIFMDEIDSVGARGGVSSAGGGLGGLGAGMGGGMGDMSGLLSTLLIEMSGFGQEHGWRPRFRTWFYKTFLRRSPPKIKRRVLTIGATNRVEALDAALLRPGRFDKKIRVSLPDVSGRRDIIEYYLSKFAHDDTMDPLILATETPGYSPADVKFLLNESLRYALFAGRRYITYADYRRAQPEHEMGLRSPFKHLAQEARIRLAYYHAGYAVGVRLFQPHHRIARIKIVRHGQAAGHVSHYPATDMFRGLQTKKQMEDRLQVLVSGKASEIEFCGSGFQTFSSVIPPKFDRESHLSATYQLIEMMVMAGMYGFLGGSVFTANSMKKKVVELQEELYQRILLSTRETMRKNQHIVKALAEVLLEKDELLADEVRAFFDGFQLYTPDPKMVIGGEEMEMSVKTNSLQESFRMPAAGD